MAPSSLFLGKTWGRTNSDPVGFRESRSYQEWWALLSLPLSLKHNSMTLTPWTVSQCLVTVPGLATYFMLQGLTPPPISPPSAPFPAMPGKWACLQESGRVDAMMSGPQAAALLKCARPQLPFFSSWKSTQSASYLPGREAHIQMPYVVGPPRPGRAWRRTQVCHKGVFATPAPLCLILDHNLLTGHTAWEWPGTYYELWIVGRLPTKGALAEWGFRLVNSCNRYSLRMFNRLGPLIMCPGIQQWMGKKLGLKGRKTSKKGNYDIVGIWKPGLKVSS